MARKSTWALITTFEKDSGEGGERPDNSLPPFPAHPIVIPPDSIGPGVPAHPIYIPIYPDNSLPGEQPGVDNELPPIEGLVPTPPIYIPPEIWPGDERPTHPIVIPPDGEPPHIDNSLPEQPVYPSHPIVIPPLPEVPDDANVALVLIKVPGQDPVWAIVEPGGGLKPNPWPEPKGGRGKRKK